MGALAQASQQVKSWPQYVADGSITAGGTAQLVLPVHQSRMLLEIQNLSNGPLWFENGAARATCAITSGAVTSISVANAGFNYSKPPLVMFFGGGNAGNSSFLGLNQYGGEAPNSVMGVGRPAQAHCVMTGSAGSQTVSSIAIDDPGAGYVIAPFVFLVNDKRDPYGCAVPSATSGRLLTAQSPPLIVNGTGCWTDQLAVYGATTGQAFLCRWMP